MSEPLLVYVRWMLEQDFPAIAAIERVSARRPWSAEDLAAIASGRRSVGIVAQQASGLCGFAIYESGRSGLNILKLAVEPERRRRGVGRRLIGAIAQRLVPPRRRRMTYDAAESDLAAQLFLRAVGFRAEAILRNFFDRPRREDAYRMVYRTHAGGRRNNERKSHKAAPRPAPVSPISRLPCGARFALR